MDQIRVTELIEFSKGSKVRTDEATGAMVIEGVKYLGPKSSNVNDDGTHNEYPLEGRVSSEKLYEGASIYLNHPGRDNPGEDRRVEDKIARLRNTSGRSTTSGSFGDLWVNPEHPLAKQIVWAAEHSPDSIALSHNAQGSGVVEGKSNKCKVTVTKVRSVDLVAAAATTFSLFESEGPMTQETKEPEAVESVVEPTESEAPAADQTEAETEGPEVDAIEALRAEVEQLKAEKITTERKIRRERMILESGLTLGESLTNAIVDSEQDEAAKSLLEELRAAAYHQNPVSGSAGSAPAPTKSVDDFKNWLRS